MQNAHAPSDVIILTALPVECKAVLYHLQDQKEIVHESGTIYYQGTFIGIHRVWRVAVAEIGMGGIAAAFEAAKAISFFQAQIALFVGIAGGIKDVKSGDIVAATKIYAYESGKVGAERFAPRPELGRSSHALEQRARAEAKNEEWLARLSGDRPDPVPQVYVGALAAGEKVLASMQSDIARLLKETYGDTLAIEMEGHGFLHAVRVNQQVYGLVIRGISDLIDDKTQADASGAQVRAARHAAAFAFQVLAKFTLPERKSEKVPVDDSKEAVKYPGENQQVAQGPVITNDQGELFHRSDRPAEVPLRTLYLRKYPKILGRESLIGRKLYDRFHEVSERCLLGHRVLPDEEAEKLSYPGSENDICSYSVVKQLNPNLIYVEGGLFRNDGVWRVPRLIAEELVASGAVMIVADVDVNEFREKKSFYKEAVPLLYSSADYGIHDDTSPTYGADETSYWGNPRQIVCKPEKMVISDWLRPVYEGISEIVVGLPVKLIGWQHLVASGNGGSTATLRNDLWDDPHDCCPFASAVNQGDGYIVLIAGDVSGDVWLKRCPDNTKWLINLSRFLVNEASLERDR